MTRRGAVAGGGLGIAAALMAHTAQGAKAQGATPVGGATPVATGEAEVLYVQTFASATIVPDPADPSAFTLTLQDGTGQTVYFSDRPERLAGTLTDEAFLDSRAFDPADPPNAAIVTLSGGTEDVLVVQLSDPAIDPATGTVTYSARLLEGTPESAELASLAARQVDMTMDENVGPITLFIDQLACSPPGSSCSTNSDCCSNECCLDIEVCPPYACL